MTDLRRLTITNAPSMPTDFGGEYYRADDVDARLAEVEAERDAARARAEGVCLACPAERLAAENARLRQERDGWKALSDRNWAEFDAMRPVVEAAEAQRDHYAKPHQERAGRWADEMNALLDLTDAAVDAYRAGQNRPETAPSATESQDLHPAGPRVEDR